MSLKNNECPNCGANLKFNNMTHTYECEYCNSSFKDKKASANGDSRVELSPDDLEMLKPESKNTSTKDSSNTIIIIVLIIMFGGPTLISILSFFASFLFMLF